MTVTSLKYVEVALVCFRWSASSAQNAEYKKKSHALLMLFELPLLSDGSVNA